METTPGERVRVSGGGPELDGIVFDTPSRTKVLVAVVDPVKGPVLRTVHPETLAERAEESPSDRVLQQLIRRTPPPGRRGGAGGSGARGGLPGHSRASGHRTTGK
jgi:hypothetical protein